MEKDIVLCTVSGRIEVISSEGYTSSMLLQAIREAIFEDNIETPENINPLVWATTTFLHDVDPVVSRIQPIWSSEGRTKDRFLFVGESKAWTTMEKAGGMRKFNSKINRSERIAIGSGYLHLTINMNYKILVVKNPDEKTLSIIIEDHKNNRLGQHAWILESNNIFTEYLKTLVNYR